MRWVVQSTLRTETVSLLLLRFHVYAIHMHPFCAQEAIFRLRLAIICNEINLSYFMRSKQKTATQFTSYSFLKVFRRLYFWTLKCYPSLQGRIQGEAIGAIDPLKPTKLTFFAMILNNSENSIRDKRPSCRPLFCHSSVVKYASSLSQ